MQEKVLARAGRNLHGAVSVVFSASASVACLWPYFVTVVTCVSVVGGLMCRGVCVCEEADSVKAD